MIPARPWNVPPAAPVVRPLAAALILLAALPAPAGETFSGQVVGVIDGDTVEVLARNKPTRVRLHGIDCPERHQDFGTQAKQLASDLAFKQVVEVEARATDRWGRTVGVVRLPDGRDLGQELVRAGLAWWYEKYAPNDGVLAGLEAEAKAAKRGLWSHPSPQRPWEFRAAVAKKKGKKDDGGQPRWKPGQRCAGYTAEAAEACAGRGCALGPPLRCSGVPHHPDPTAPCACVCPHEREMCSMVPSAR